MTHANPKLEDDLLTLDDALEELVGAEDFLNYFCIPFEPSIVHVNRLHIMQRFHDYLSQVLAQIELAADQQSRFEVYRDQLSRAYQDFVESDALTEKVFKVFHMHEPQTTFVSIDDLFK
jgi:nitrogenase-stabilizing/protective protein